MTEIVGTLDSAPLANEVIADLLSSGLTKDQISLVMSSKAKQNFEFATKDAGDRAVVDTAIGAGTGGVLGALLMGLTTAAAIVIPGTQVLAVGPLVAALTGAGVGAAGGALVGALSAAGISAVQMADYSNDIKGGKAVIVVHAKNEAQALAAREILMEDGAVVRSQTAA